MSLQTIVTLPDGKKVPLAGLETEDITACDGCGRTEAYAAPAGGMIPAVIKIQPLRDTWGEGATIQAHLCGHPQCQLSAMARHFEAIWPLPEPEATS